VEFKSDFSVEDLKTYRDWFLKYDANKSGELEIFELNVMYQEMGEPKTNLQLKQLIADASTSNTGGINYREFLAVILKDKKGTSKGPWKGFALGVGKVHDDNKAVGKKANFFEQEVAKQKGYPLEEEKKENRKGRAIKGSTREGTKRKTSTRTSKVERRNKWTTAIRMNFNNKAIII